jgi:histidinol-phosphate aminotransferase
MPGRSQFEAIRPEVLGVSAYTLEPLEAAVKLDQNENPFELPDAIKRGIVERVLALGWNRYPEFVPVGLIDALSRFTGWTVKGIVVGNGSNELIQAALMITLGPGRTITIPQPTFTLYGLMATTLGATVRNVPLNHDMTFDVEALSAAASDSEVVVLCSPNNPTGTVLALEDVARIAESANGLVILDEAYHEFSGGSACSLLERHDNVMLLRTFSKAMAMAGLRFGYMLTNPEIAAEIVKAKLPYNVNIFTIAAVQTVLDNPGIMDESVQAVIVERSRMEAALAALAGVETFPSEANFILIRTRHPARRIFDALYRKGVLVRDVSRYPQLERALRVTVGTPEENDRFMAALAWILETFE